MAGRRPRPTYARRHAESSPTNGRSSQSAPGGWRYRPPPRASPNRRARPASPDGASASRRFPCLTGGAEIATARNDGASNGCVGLRQHRQPVWPLAADRWRSETVLFVSHRRDFYAAPRSIRRTPINSTPRSDKLAQNRCHVAFGAVAPAQAGVDRPPQFIVMAFDNCTELERWQELTDFAAELNRDSDRLHFTFFVSGSNFLADGSRNIYEGPHQRRGYSRISFGGSPEQVRKRVEYPNALYLDGHEIASHAVGHFNGAPWSVRDWEKEFSAFSAVLKNVGPNNGLAEPKFAFSITDVIGFRALYHATGAGRYGALKAHGFRYDTSGVSVANAWPEKVDGVWRFNLAMLKIQGSGKGTLSMDYNFFLAQSRAVYDPHRYEAVREQTLQTYLRYFKTNYAGNRAPLHIGHHFMNYGGGAYNEALKSFARAVCGLPEVRCVTYAKLADFMDPQNAETLAAYRKGDFARAATPALNVAGVLR